MSLRAVPIGKTRNQMPKIRGSTILCWRYVCCNFSGGYGAPQTPQGYPPQTPLLSVTRSMLRFRCMRRLDPIHAVFSKFLLFLHKSKHAKDVGPTGSSWLRIVGIVSVGTESVGIVSASHNNSSSSSSSYKPTEVWLQLRLWHRMSLKMHIRPTFGFGHKVLV